MFNKTAKFKKLQQRWYKKLKAKGFKDIEKPNSPHLKTWTSYTGADAEAASGFVSEPNRVKLEYYDLARKFLQTHTFKSERHRQMFEMHVEGLGYRQIAKRFKVTKFKVSGIMKPLLDEMKGTRLKTVLKSWDEWPGKIAVGDTVEFPNDPKTYAVLALTEDGIVVKALE